MRVPHPPALIAALASVAALSTSAVALALPAEAGAFDPALEAKNFAKVQERVANVTGTPAFQTRLAQQNIAGPIQVAQIFANDPERLFPNVCAIRGNECAGDVRFYDWQQSGYGVMTPVVFTARSGAVISGTVWGTLAGPAQRPGIVITTGSVQAPETLYWGLAATYAKAGYIVLTYDVQGQGQSDTFGEAPDQQEGVPSQAGQPFYDGTEDALDFLLSSPGGPFGPRPSCGNANNATATDHSAKHDRRVASGLATAFNPMHALVDPTRIGIAGHSLGASAVSFVGQKDPRVDALIAYDNLSAPDAGVFGTPDCPAAPGSRTAPPITKPGLGISNDYGITPTPFTSDPDPEEKNDAFSAYAAAGVDTMQVNIRGGSHEESALLPPNTVGEFGLASWRGQDLLAWYTLGWLDKYVKGEGGADDRLLTDRWCDDDLSQGVDLNDDGNMYSFYFRSRHDFSLSGGGNASSDDMRTGCPATVTDPAYDFVATANTPDSGGPPGTTTDTDGDGVPDIEDACPSVIGTLANLGCPPAPASPSTPGNSIPPVLNCANATPRLGGKGRDTLTGTDQADRLLGRAGRDRLAGAKGDDCLSGQRGADRLDGGTGADILSGGNQGDRIIASDGVRDVVRCGGGRDRVRADAIDSLSRCERVRRD